MNSPVPPRALRLGERVVDLETGDVDGGRERLTTRERELLAWLAARPGHAVSRDELRTVLWGYADSSASRAVDSTVARLRRKIEEDPARPRHLLKHHGEGYRLVVPPEPSQASAAGARDGELSRLHAELDRGARVVTVTGLAGMGKSWLLRALPRPGLRLHCGGARTAEALAGRVAAALGTDLGADEPVARAGESLAVRTRLLILDDVDRVEGGAWLERWLELAPELQILAARRLPWGVPGEVALPLGPLPPAHARMLLLEACATRRLPPPGEATLARLLELADGHPLLVELLVGRLAVLGDAVVEATGGALRRPSLLEESWAVMPERARVGLAALAAFAGPVPPAWATAAGVEPDALEALMAAGLVVQRDGMLHVPALLRDHARGRTGWEEACRAHARAMLARAPVEGGPPGTGTRPGPWCDELEAAAWQCAALRDAGPRDERSRNARLAAECLLAAWPYRRRRGPVAPTVGLATTLLALDLADDTRRGVALVSGQALAMVGETAAALRAFDVAAAGEDAAAVDALLAAASIHRRTGRWDAVEAHLARAAALAQPGSAVVGRVLASRAVQRWREDAYDEAAALLERALAIHETWGEHHCAALDLADLGAVRGEAGRFVEARRDIGRALAYFEQVEDNFCAAACLGNLAIVEQHAGEFERAEAFARRALAVHVVTGARVYRIAALLALADVLALSQGPRPAAEMLREALALARAAGQRDWEGRVMVALSHTARLEDRAEEARQLCEGALERQAGLPGAVREATTRLALGLAALHIGAFDDARASLTVAAELASAAPPVAAEALAALARCEARAGRLQAAEAAIAGARSARARTRSAAVEGLVAVAEVAVEQAGGAAAPGALARARAVVARGFSLQSELGRLVAGLDGGQLSAVSHPPSAPDRAAVQGD